MSHEEEASIACREECRTNLETRCKPYEEFLSVCLTTTSPRNDGVDDPSIVGVSDDTVATRDASSSRKRARRENMFEVEF